jgi:hypothetical protein
MAERGLPVRGGLSVAAAKRLTGVRPCGHSGGWELTESCGKGRGAPGGGGVLTVGTKGWHGEGLRPAADGGRWACVLEPGGEKRVAGGAMSDVAGGVGAFYMAGGEGVEAVEE